jgi:hypothetical protein
LGAGNCFLIFHDFSPSIFPREEGEGEVPTTSSRGCANYVAKRLGSLVAVFADAPNCGFGLKILNLPHL